MLTLWTWNGYCGHLRLSAFAMLDWGDATGDRQSAIFAPTWDWLYEQLATWAYFRRGGQ